METTSIVLVGMIAVAVLFCISVCLVETDDSVQDSSLDRQSKRAD